MFKISKNQAPPQMYEIFKLKDQPQYNLRYNSWFSRPLVTSVYKDTESLSFLGPKLWDILPDTYKDIPDLNSFKLALKKWRPVNFLCRICKIYITNVGFALKLILNLSDLDKLKKNFFYQSKYHFDF